MTDSELSELNAAHARFLVLVKDIRPELHRYCARMTGSAFDGEDVVQEALATAYYELSQLRELPSLRPWLFRIAHTRALNYLAARSRRATTSLDDAGEVEAPAAAPDDAVAAREAVDAAIGRFLELPPAQRACVILKDVLDASLEDVAAALDMTIPAVKAALHRGRSRLAAVARQDPDKAPFTPELLRYVQLFNAHDWDGVRAMLAEDVRLEMVGRLRRRGAAATATYFTNYDRARDWILEPASMDGVEVIAVRQGPGAAAPTYVIRVVFGGGQVRAIRDFRYATYVVDGARFAGHMPIGSVTSQAR
jgi:RNA polymerase sigma factor (sigma-70 family)